MNLDRTSYWCSECRTTYFSNSLDESPCFLVRDCGLFWYQMCVFQHWIHRLMTKYWEWMSQDAEEKGLLKPGGVIVEGTAGNTGIGLALVANAKGYKTVIVIPQTQSQVEHNLIICSSFSCPWWLVLVKVLLHWAGSLFSRCIIEGFIPSFIICRCSFRTYPDHQPLVLPSVLYKRNACNVLMIVERQMGSHHCRRKRTCSALQVQHLWR